MEVRTPLSTDAGRLARVGEVIADVTGRLRGVCASLPEEEFAALMRQIAEVTVKYEALVEMRAARLATPPYSHLPLSDPEPRQPPGH
jgi:hypothetical protein